MKGFGYKDESACELLNPVINMKGRNKLAR